MTKLSTMPLNPYQRRYAVPEGCTTINVPRFGEVCIHSEKPLTAGRRGTIRNAINKRRVCGTYWYMAGILIEQ